MNTGGMKFTAVKSSTIDKAFKLALFALEEQARTDCNYFCREDQGELKRSIKSKVKDTTLQLSWNTVYAHRVYTSGKPSTDKNPHASLEWAERAQKIFGREWNMILQKGLAKAL